MALRYVNTILEKMQSYQIAAQRALKLDHENDIA